MIQDCRRRRIGAEENSHFELFRTGSVVGKNPRRERCRIQLCTKKPNPPFFSCQTPPAYRISNLSGPLTSPRSRTYIFFFSSKAQGCAIGAGNFGNREWQCCSMEYMQAGCEWGKKWTLSLRFSPPGVKVKRGQIRHDVGARWEKKDWKGGKRGRLVLPGIYHVLFGSVYCGKDIKDGSNKRTMMSWKFGGMEFDCMIYYDCLRLCGVLFFLLEGVKGRFGTYCIGWC